MAMDESDEMAPMEVVDPEMRQLLGMFDMPAFARRGQDVEFGLKRLHERLRRERDEMLDMVRLRLKQWASAVEGPHAWPLAFADALDDLWRLSGAEPPRWGIQVQTPRRHRTIARDLVASVERFNRRWSRRVEELNLGPINESIDQYNRYYVLEKECSLGSARLAAQHFIPHEPVTPERLLIEHPLLPMPTLRD